MPVVRAKANGRHGLALLAKDASVDSWFREIRIRQGWRVYLATGLDFREKNRASFESIQPRPQGLLLDDFQNGGSSGEEAGSRGTKSPKILEIFIT